MDKIKVLFLAASPDVAPLRLDEEIRAITRTIRASENRDALHVVSYFAVRPDDLQQALLEHKPHVLHFSGHGSESAELVLLDKNGQPKPVSARAMVNLLKTLRDNLRLVVLNACYSQTQAKAITQVVECAVGMKQAIGGDAAVRFAAALYRGLAFGRSVRAAFDLGINALMLDGIPEDTTPRLHARTRVDPAEVFLTSGSSADGAEEPGFLQRDSPSAAPAPPMQARFVQDQERVMIWLDSSRDAFINHLVSHDVIWIVGITNEHLADHLRNAFALRNERAWKEIHVLFQARHLVDHFREGGPERGPAWERGVRETIDFLLQSGPQKAKKLDIRHVNRIIPFVGQFYDYSHVRVAFVLPVPDIQTSCYLNCRGVASGQSDGPPALPPTRDEAAKQLEAVQYTFGHLRNVSTPLLTANVVGRRATDESFQFESLMPQNNWRHSSAVFGGRPAHLVTFVLLHDNAELFLQLRDENNANGQLHKLGVLPGKVNDEDFFDDVPPAGSAYWNEIYEMQKAFDALGPGIRDSPAAKAARQRATAAFSAATQIQPGASVPVVRLLAVCRRAAVRYLDEKLGLGVFEPRFHSVSERHYYVEKPDYSLYIQLYALRLTPDETNQIRIRRPFANLIRTDLEAFRKLWVEGRLTLFLEQHFEEILVFLRARLGDS